MKALEPTISARPLDELLDELLAHADDCPSTEGSPPDLRGLEPVLEARLAGVRYVVLREIAQPDEAVVALSSRELEIARMIARGHTNRTIAAVLEISQWTVSTHLRRIFAKVGVSSRAAMVAELLAQGLLAGPRGKDDARHKAAPLPP